MWFTIGFCVACLLAVYWLPARWLVWVALGVACLAAALTALWRRGRRGKVPLERRLGCAGLGLALGLLWCWGYDALQRSPARAVEGRYDRLEAVLCDYPLATDYGHRVDAWALVDGQRIKTRFYLYGDLPELEPGDKIAGAFSLRRADQSADGTLRLDLQAKGILLTGSGRVQATADGGSPLRFLPVRLGRRISARLAALIPANAAGLPRAMLTADRSGLSQAEQSAMSLAGASHVLAVSGLHVSMLMGVLWLLTGRGKWNAILNLLLLGFFVLMTGASPSVVRAAWMLVPVLLAPLVQEEHDPPSALALAALVLLLGNPWVVADLSFQLSFAAVAGLLLVTPRLQNYFTSLPRVRRALRWAGLTGLPLGLRNMLLRFLRRLIRGFFAGISATLGALIFTTPIAAAVFGSVPVYGVLTNLLVLFPAALCLSGSLLVLGLGLLSTTLGSLSGAALAWIVRLIIWVCRTVSRLPGSQLYLNGYGLGFLFFCYCILLLAALLRERRLGLPLCSMLAALCIAVGLQSLEARAASFTLCALDVGQGQCVCARTDAYTALIDCGGSGGERAGSDAAAWLLEHGASRVDALVLTHYDWDHVSGAATLLALLPVETVYLPDVDGDPENRATVEAAALAAGAELCYVRENQTIPFPGGQMQLFAPVSDRTDNAACVCVLYSVGAYDMLVTGDLDKSAEYVLLDQNALPPVELYVAGHHGSASSSSAALLERIQPDTVFISVGQNNSYGLPAQATLERLLACGAAVYRTDESGNLEIGR